MTTPQQPADQPSTTGLDVSALMQKALADFSAASEAKPLGVPAGFTADVRSRATAAGYRGMVPTPPRYFQGDEVRQFQTMSPEDRAVVQQTMKDAGLIDSYLPGYLDDSTKAGFSFVLETANREGSDWRTAMTNVAHQAAPVRKSPKLTPSLDLAAVADQVARQRIGRRLTTAETSTLTSAFQSLEAQQQQANDPNSVQVPQADSFFNSKLDQNPEADQYALTNTMLGFFDLMKGA